MTPARFSHRSRLQLAAIAPACRPLLGQSAAAPGKRSAVALVKGDRRRQNVASAMEAIDCDLHAKGCRRAAQLSDPEPYIFSACMLKTHHVVVATLNVKNMALGAPLHGVNGERSNDKRVVHNGLRQAQALQPYWGLRGDRRL